MKRTNGGFQGGISLYSVYNMALRRIRKRASGQGRRLSEGHHGRRLVLERSERMAHIVIFYEHFPTLPRLPIFQSAECYAQRVKALHPIIPPLSQPVYEWRTPLLPGIVIQPFNTLSVRPGIRFVYAC